MKRYIILLVSLLCLFWLVGTCSYANTVDYSNFDSYNYNGDILDFFKQSFEYVTSYNYDDDWTINGTTTQGYLNDLLDKLSDDNCQFIEFAINENMNTSTYYNGRSISYRIYKTPPTNGEYLNYTALYRKTNDNKVAISRATAGSSNYVISGNLTGNQKQKYLINKNNSNIRSNQLWYKSKSNNQSFESSLKYFSNKTQLINVHNSGVTGSMIKADYTLNGFINIGRLESYNSYNELQGYLGVFSGYNSTDNASYYDTIATFQYNKINNTQLKNNLRLDYDTGQVYINSSVLSYNHAYSLYFTGDGSDTTTVVNYYFVPYGSTATSGDINTDNPTGLDFDFINSILHVANDSDSGNTEYIVNNEFVNSSGDIFGVVYNDRDNWGFGDFVGSTINNIYNALFNYDNVTMDFGFLGQHSSAELTTPSDNALIVIVGLFCNSFLLIGAVSWFWRSILAVSTLSIDKFIKDDEDLVLF